jgi:hypothetical protein
LVKAKRKIAKEESGIGQQGFFTEGNEGTKGGRRFDSTVAADVRRL